MSLTSIIGEYILGTETERYRKKEESMVREHVLDKTKMNHCLIEMYRGYIMRQAIGKMVPNLSAIVTFALYGLTKEPYIFSTMAITESMRAAMHIVNIKLRKNVDGLEKEIKKRSLDLEDAEFFNDLQEHFDEAIKDQKEDP